MTPHERASETTAHALGESYIDICQDGASCVVCSLWQHAGEPRERWVARVRQLLDATCTHGHPWTEANTYRVKDTDVRQCRGCKRESTRERRARQRLEAVA